MSPTSSAIVKNSNRMRAIRSKNTRLEMLVFNELKKQGVKFKTHYGRLPGSPDLVVPILKKALFIDGDFWHGYDYKRVKPKLSQYWRNKIESNMRRDKKNHKDLKSLGWDVLRVWEHQIVNKPSRTIAKLIAYLASA